MINIWLVEHMFAHICMEGTATILELTYFELSTSAAGVPDWCLWCSSLVKAFAVLTVWAVLE